MNFSFPSAFETNDLILEGYRFSAVLLVCVCFIYMLAEFSANFLNCGD